MKGVIFVPGIYTNYERGKGLDLGGGEPPLKLS